MHAKFILTDKDELKLQDSKSKYGTYLLNIDVKTPVTTEAVQLEEGNVIRFGMFQNDWIVHRQNIKTAVSKNSKERGEKAAVQENKQDKPTRSSGRKRTVIDISDDEEATPKETQPRSSRKRAAETESLESDAMFTFNTNSSKKSRPLTELQEQSQTTSGNVLHCSKDFSCNTETSVEDQMHTAAVQEKHKPTKPTTRKRVSSQITSDEQETVSTSNQITEDIQTSKRSTRSNKTLNDTNFFNFSSASSSGNAKKSQKQKQQIPDKSENSKEQSKQAAVQEKHDKPTRSSGRKRTIRDISDDEEASPKVTQPLSSRKRAAATAPVETGGLFAFNTNFAKKSRPSIEAQEQTQKVSGIIPMQKVCERSPVKKVYQPESNDSNDSGVWLSKKMSSFRLESIDGIKSEPVETTTEASAIEPSIDTQDTKPFKFFFNVEENSNYLGDSSSILSKRKSFVKKQNFKSQKNIVTMTLVNIAKQRDTRDEF